MVALSLATILEGLCTIKCLWASPRVYRISGFPEEFVKEIDRWYELLLPSFIMLLMSVHTVALSFVNGENEFILPRHFPESNTSEKLH